MTSGKLPEAERRNKQAGFAYAIQTFRGSHGAARELVREIEADIRNRVLGEIADAFETRKGNEAMLCSEVAAYCREQARS